MAVNKTNYIKIKNQNFSKFCCAIEQLMNLPKVKSSMRDASLDDSDKNHQEYLYDAKYLDMDVVKLDDISRYFKEYMNNNRNNKDFNQPMAVDAVCIDKDGNWYLIEFKNRKLYKDGKVDHVIISDVKKKLIESLWLLFSIDSMSASQLFPTDITDFARKHVTYIVVVRRDKNPEEYHRIRQSEKNHYTPKYLNQYKGYYFKDIFLFSENELGSFIKEFKC